MNVEYGKTSAPDKPLVSIITVCLNSEKHLEQTIKSVIGQTYQNIEYIIIDGGSIDGTLDIIKKYQSRIAYRVSEPDRGLYDAMNKGIARAQGDLVGIINSDDYYQPDAVEIIVKEFLKDNEAGVFSGELLFFVDEPKSRIQWRRRLAGLGTFGQEIVHPAMFVKKEIYWKFKYDLRYKLEADVDFVYNLCFNGVKFHTCPDLIAAFRVGGISKSYRSLIDGFMIRHKYFGLKFLPRNMAILFVRSINWSIKKFILKNNFSHPLLKWYRKRRNLI
ncbi:MAG: glycosyltransferase family 2 protein [Candidatus Omnitrophota bacterium]